MWYTRQGFHTGIEKFTLRRKNMAFLAWKRQQNVSTWNIFIIGIKSDFARSTQIFKQQGCGEHIYTWSGGGQFENPPPFPKITFLSSIKSHFADAPTDLSTYNNIQYNNINTSLQYSSQSVT